MCFQERRHRMLFTFDSAQRKHIVVARHHGGSGDHHGNRRDDLGPIWSSTWWAISGGGVSRRVTVTAWPLTWALRPIHIHLADRIRRRALYHEHDVGGERSDR
jgi:hypothetical protein